MAEITLDENHIYRVDGRQVVNVTHALQLLDDRVKDPWYLQRGTFIHRATELHDRDELDPDSVDPQIAGYVQAYIIFKIDTGFKPTIIEKPMYHKKFGYAGKPDVIGPLNDCLSLIDKKSGAKALVDPLQGAAYFELAIANGIPVKKCFDLYLKQDGTYKLEPVTNMKENLLDFLSCLRVTRRKEKL